MAFVGQYQDASARDFDRGEEQSLRLDSHCCNGKRPAARYAMERQSGISTICGIVVVLQPPACWTAAGARFLPIAQNEQLIECLIGSRSIKARPFIPFSPMEASREARLSVQSVIPPSLALAFSTAASVTRLDGSDAGVVRLLPPRIAHRSAIIFITSFCGLLGCSSLTNFICSLKNS